MQHPLIPVLIDLVGKRDEVTLSEAQLAIILWLKVIQRLAAWLVQGWHTLAGRPDGLVP